MSQDAESGGDVSSTLDPESIYVALIGDPARMRNLRRIRYWCSDRCLLLDAVAVVDTILIHQKRYKHSDVVNQRRSSPAGRAKNTTDGDNHWKPSTYFIETSALNYPNDRPTPRLGVQCDHVGVTADGSVLTLSAPDFHADWQEGHSEIIMRRDGTRYAVR